MHVFLIRRLLAAVPVIVVVTVFVFALLHLAPGDPARNVAGLRVGIRMLDGKKQWSTGSLLQAELFAKNVTDKAITFT